MTSDQKWLVLTAVALLSVTIICLGSEQAASRAVTNAKIAELQRQLDKKSDDRRKLTESEINDLKERVKMLEGKRPQMEVIQHAQQ